MKTMKNFSHLNQELVSHMRKATFVSADPVDIDHVLNWNHLREQAKQRFTLKEICALDGSGLIVDTLIPAIRRD